jgi:protochlorophyllide reductase
MVRFVFLACMASIATAFMPVNMMDKALRPASIVSTGTPVVVDHVAASYCNMDTGLAAAATGMQEKYYTRESKELPNFLGGLKIGLKKLVVVTGASSGLGLNCAVALAKDGDHHVIMACRDVEKGKQVAKEKGMPDNSYTVMKLELASLQSVRDFVANLKAFKSIRPLNNLICNAAVYRPTDPDPAWTDDGFEMSMGVNHLGHFLLVNLLLDDMSKARDPRICVVGSITGNSNTVGGGLVYPRADLGNLSGLEKGAKNPISMVDGKPFFGAKAYKDSKVLNMMTVSELHRRYHDETGIVFSSMYPGCIADTALFREKREWFRKGFPWFMKYVTGGYVGEEEAGERLAQVIADPKCSKSGVYWSWNGNAKSVGTYSDSGKPTGAGGAGGEIFENEQSDTVTNVPNAKKMWKYSRDAVGLSKEEMYKGGLLEE